MASLSIEVRGARNSKPVGFGVETEPEGHLRLPRLNGAVADALGRLLRRDLLLARGDQRRQPGGKIGVGVGAIAGLFRRHPLDESLDVIPDIDDLGKLREGAVDVLADNGAE